MHACIPEGKNIKPFQKVTRMALSLVHRGKICVAAASELLQDIANGRGKYAEAKLKSLEKDAVELANQAEMLAKRLEAVDKLQQERDAEMLRQSGKLGRQEEQLQAQKNRVVSNLAGQKKVLQQKESELSSAERNLQFAERELREAIEEKETNVKRCAKIGAIVSGVLLPVVGAPFGAAIGAAVGAIQNAVSEKVEDAHSYRDRRTLDVNNAKSAVTSSENEISSLEPRMRSLASDIERLNQQRKDLHRKRSEIKTAIPILKEAIEFWHLFSSLSKDGENQATILQKIVTIANKTQVNKEQFKLLHSRGTQRMTSTFFEAWADIEKEAARSVGHYFIVDYSCERCRRKCRALPHLYGSDFICSTCHQALNDPFMYAITMLNIHLISTFYDEYISLGFLLKNTILYELMCDLFI